jgi:Fe2+ or Zn2+ uptake regulation protein
MLDTKQQDGYNHYKLIDTTNKSMSSLDSFCAQLQARGRRITPQRRAIIQVLLENSRHLTAEHVYTRVRYAIPGLSPATVYNTLRELAEMGMLLELDLGLGERHYDIVTVNHAHLVCLACGRVEDVPCDLEKLEPLPEHTHGFKVLDSRVIYRGYCPVCLALQKGKN